MTKTTLCPFCLYNINDYQLTWQCASISQKCAPVVNEKLKKNWGIDTPQPYIFQGKKSLLNTSPKCPKCHANTHLRCCPLCAKRLAPNILNNKHSHILCIASHTSSVALFYQSIYYAFEQFIAQQKNILLEESASSQAPFFLTFRGLNKPSHSLVFHSISWENIAHTHLHSLIQQSFAQVVFMPSSPQESLTPTIKFLQKHLEKDPLTAFLLEGCESILEHIPPNHIFFRHMPHNATYQKKAAHALSQALKDLLIPLWSSHTIKDIEAFFKRHKFFANTSNFQDNNLIAPRGWKVDEFILWVLSEIHD